MSCEKNVRTSYLMENIQTLTQLLNNSRCDYQIFDLGRRIKTIAKKEFADVE
ncbi:DUF3549 family protein, partial [Vibrio alginolyticus]